MRHAPIILAAHGCGDDSAVNRRVRDLCADVARLRDGGPITCGFNLGTPSFAGALDRLPAGEEVDVVPLMMASGYFSGRVLPDRLRSAKTWAARGDDRVRILPPIGTLAAVGDAAVRRVGRELAGRSPSAAQVIVVGHGTRRNAHSRNTTLELAARIDHDLGAPSLAAFLDDDPLLETIECAAHAATVVVLPMLLGGGDHAAVDIPRRLRIDAASAGPAHGPRAVRAHGREFVLIEPIIFWPELAAIIAASVGSAERIGAPA